MFVLLAGPGALQTIAQLPCFGPGTGLGRTYSISIFYDISMVYLLRAMLMIRIAHVLSPAGHRLRARRASMYRAMARGLRVGAGLALLLGLCGLDGSRQQCASRLGPRLALVCRQMLSCGTRRRRGRQRATHGHAILRGGSGS